MFTVVAIPLTGIGATPVDGKSIGNRSAVSLTADPDRPGKGGVREMNRLQ